MIHDTRMVMYGNVWSCMVIVARWGWWGVMGVLKSDCTHPKNLGGGIYFNNLTHCICHNTVAILLQNCNEYITIFLTK